MIAGVYGVIGLNGRYPQVTLYDSGGLASASSSHTMVILPDCHDQHSLTASTTHQLTGPSAHCSLLIAHCSLLIARSSHTMVVVQVCVLIDVIGRVTHLARCLSVSLLTVDVSECFAVSNFCFSFQLPLMNTSVFSSHLLLLISLQVFVV